MHEMCRPETDRNWTCRIVLHAGDGPPGKEEQIYGLHFMDAAEAAEYFAEGINDREMHEGGMTDSDFDGVSLVVEVRTTKGWKRFGVRCRVVRQYTATELHAEEANQ